MYARVVWGWLRRNAEWLWAPALFAAAALFLYREVWLVDRGTLRWFGWDCLEVYWPHLAFLRNSLASGEIPLWNPFERGGFPFHADPEPALFYPVNWLFALLGLGLGGTPPWMIQAKALLHHALAGLVLHAYLRSRGLPRIAAAAGGLIALANSPMIYHKASSIFWPVVWAPLVWIAIDRVIERAGEPGWWRRGVLLGGAVALAGSVGSPPGFFFALLTAVPYGAFRLAGALTAGRKRWAFTLAAQGRALAVALAVALALLLIILIPAAEVTEASPRAVRSIGWSVANPLRPGPALESLVSPPIGGASTYAGIALLGLIVAALAGRPRDRGAPILFTLCGLFLLCLSFGARTPLLPFLVKHAPAFGWFRNPQRYSVPAMLCFAAAAGHGMAALLAAGKPAGKPAGAAPGRRVPPLVLELAPLAALLAPLVALLALWGPARDKFGRTVMGSLTFWLIGASCAAVVVLAPRLAAAWSTRRWPAKAARLVTPVFAAALALLTPVDVDHFYRGHSLARSERPVDDQEDRRWIADLAGDATRDWRIYDEFLMEQRAGVRLGVRDFRGYPAGDPMQDARYLDVVRRARANPELLQAFNVRWLFHAPHHRLGHHGSWVKNDPPAEHYRKIDAKRWEALHPAPVVAWYGQVAVVPGAKAALEALVAEQAAGRSGAVVEKNDARALPELSSSAPPVAGRITGYSLHRVTAEVDAPAEGLVILNEVHAPGWRVRVDGREATPLRANVILRAVHVPAGRHVIVWTYRPRHWWWLAPLWLAGVASLLAAAVGPAVARRLAGSSIFRAWRSRRARAS